MISIFRQLKRNVSLNHNVRNFYLTKFVCLDNSFSPEEQAKILRILNNNDNLDTFLRSRISKKVVAKILDFKKQHDSFRSINDLLDVKGVPTRSVRLLCCKLLENADSLLCQSNLSIKASISQSKDECDEKTIQKQKVKKLLSKDFQKKVSPPVVGDHLNIGSAAAVVLMENQLCWVVINGSDNWTNQVINDWGFLSIDQAKSSRNLLDSIIAMQDVLPRADVFILQEESFLTRQKHAAYEPYLSQIQLNAVAISLIYSSFGSVDAQEKMFFIKKEFPARLFGFKVGNEIVSSQNTVTDFLSRSSLSEEKFELYIQSLNQTQFSEEVVAKYLSCTSSGKEYLCQPLLLAKTFVLNLLNIKNT